VLGFEPMAASRRYPAGVPQSGAVSRRRFLARSAAGVLGLYRPVDTFAAARLRQLGVLGVQPTLVSTPLWRVFLHGLQEAGYVEGKNLAIHLRYSEGRAERFPELARDLVRQQVEVIFVYTTPAALAARDTSAAVPVIFATAIDPVGAGLAASLARPGGNVTGNTTLSPELSAKRLEILREAIPGVTKVAVLSYAGNPASALMLKQTQDAATRLGLVLNVYGVLAPEDLDGAFAAMARQRPDALVVFADAFFVAHRERVTKPALALRLPTILESRAMTEAGGLLSYGASYLALFRHGAGYVDRVLKGARPSDLPFEQARQFELVINTKTAGMLTLTIPRTLLARADHIVE
jgi:putative tryptophan/tyrosine transport system substrate-binding protein